MTWKSVIAIGIVICVAGILELPVLKLGSALLTLAVMVGGFATMFVGFEKMKPYFIGCFGFLLGIVFLPPWARWAWASVTGPFGQITTPPTMAIGSHPAVWHLPTIPWSTIILWALLGIAVLFLLLVVGRLTVMHMNRRLESWWKRERAPERPRARERTESPDPPREKLPAPERREEIGI